MPFVTPPDKTTPSTFLTALLANGSPETVPHGAGIFASTKEERESTSIVAPAREPA